jgi:hypothetical protein
MYSTNKVRLDHLVPFEKNPIAQWVGRLTNMDADEGIIFSRQLEFINQTLYETKYPMLKARDLFPVDSRIPSAAESFTYYIVDKHGAFELITNYSDDLRNIEHTGEQSVGMIKGFGAAVAYSTQDIRAAQMAGIPLNDMQFRTARELWERRLDEIAFNGLPQGNLVGVMTHPNIPTGAVPNGAAASPLWINKTPDEILADLNAMSAETINTTNGVESPDHIVMPIAQYEHISVTPRSNVSDTTILEFFLRTNIHIKTIIPWYKLKGAGTGGADVMFSYRRDPSTVELVISQEFEVFPPQERNLAFKIPTHARTGGLKIRYPLSFRIKEGI